MQTCMPENTLTGRRHLASGHSGPKRLLGAALAAKLWSIDQALETISPCIICRTSYQSPACCLILGYKWYYLCVKPQARLIPCVVTSQSLPGLVLISSKACTIPFCPPLASIQRSAPAPFKNVFAVQLKMYCIMYIFNPREEKKKRDPVEKSPCPTLHWKWGGFVS